MRLCLFAICLLLLPACGEKHPVKWETIELPNSCWVNAEGYQAAYTAANSQAPWFWSRVLVIKQSEAGGSEPNAHVIAIITWPDGVYAYDSTYGTRKLTREIKLRENPMTMANLWGADFLSAYYTDQN